ncbi:hypothetical protein N9E26_01110 [bacterium]|nr:hypothetical protein [bacterium]
MEKFMKIAKKLLALTLLLVSCSETQTSSTEEIGRLNLIGECTDLEVPSRFKPIDTYEVEGWLRILKQSNDGLRTSGLLVVTQDEILKRRNRPDLEESDNIDEWLALSDTPSIEIYEFPSYLLNETDWEKLPAVHNYDVNYSVYAERKAECSLIVESKEGFIPVEILEKETLCFDTIGCLMRDINDFKNQ